MGSRRSDHTAGLTVTHLPLRHSPVHMALETTLTESCRNLEVVISHSDLQC